MYAELVAGARGVGDDDLVTPFLPLRRSRMRAVSVAATAVFVIGFMLRPSRRQRRAN